MKTCRTCNEKKPIEDYYKHKEMLDGRLHICKDCTRARIAKHRELNLERIRGYDRKRGRTEKRKGKNREYAKTDQGRKKAKEGRDRWMEANGHKRKAHFAVSAAVKAGMLTRPEGCEKCGKGGRIEGHHEDYSKPLSVLWLCSLCHRKEHLKYKR